LIPLQTPTTDDERRTELLRLMGVRGHAGVYTLGNFARYVTVYAQQVRALNLVDTLAKSGRLSARGRVAVIGGGISGLTAAAALAIRGVEKVTVFEREQQTMRLQRSSRARWLHPRIYDWPMQSQFGPDAGLPIMSWKADYASKVVETLDEQWMNISKQVKGRLNPVKLGITQINLESGDKKPAISIAGGRKETFDIVVIAIGFGLDNHEHTFGYWADSPWDNL
jgi:NADPH-dependent glutamate synthase beta subunit-like oxidoreductase